MAKRKRKASTSSNGKHAGGKASGEASAFWKGASALSERARAATVEARRKARDKASEALDALAGEATRIVDEHKGKAVDRVDRVASAVHQTGGVLRAAKLTAAGEYLEYAAAAMDELTDYLDEGDVRQLLDDAADLARKHPALAAASVVVVGLAVGRFLAAGRGVSAAASVVKGGGAARKAATNGALALVGRQLLGSGGKRRRSKRRE